MHPLLAQHCGAEGGRLAATGQRSHAEMDAELAAVMAECEALGFPAPAEPAAPAPEAAEGQGPAPMAISSEGGEAGTAPAPAPGSPTAHRRALVKRMQALEQVCVRPALGGARCPQATTCAAAIHAAAPQWNRTSNACTAAALHTLAGLHRAPGGGGG